jgi:hypothetical protein
MNLKMHLSAPQHVAITSSLPKTSPVTTKVGCSTFQRSLLNDDAADGIP